MSKRHHKYLNAIGIASDDPCVFNTTLHDKKRDKRFKHELKKHSFDGRETWSMDYTLYTWLYEHIMWYDKHAPIDTTFYKIEIPDFNEKKKRMCKHRTIEVTQQEAMHIICDNIEFVLRNENMWNDNEREANNRGYYALRVMAEIIPLMWW